MDINFTELIRDYRMFKKEVVRLQNIIYGFSIPMSNWGVAQYGIDAAMPKGSKGKSVKELDKMDVIEQRQLTRLKEYERKVYAIESAGDLLDRDILKIVYDCMLSGMTRRQIAKHLEMSVDSVDKLRSDVRSQICSNTIFSNMLHYEKNIV